MSYILLQLLAVLKTTLEKLTDEALMHRFSDGNHEAFEMILSRYEKRIQSFIFRYVGDQYTAQDLVQETFMRVIRSADRYQPTAAFSTWILKIARNLCTDYARKHSGSKQALPLNEATSQQLRSHSDTEKATLNKEIRQALDQAIKMLPAKQKEVFILRQSLNLSFAEIANVVESSENTVKSRMRYALESLRLELNDFYHGRSNGGVGV